ncbi:MAG: glycosyltransferase family 2 protein [Pyrinomonadaceae bacterium]|nr:glycosyltransferase family 2 protein [Pyrinomonadaceae bacterium]
MNLDNSSNQSEIFAFVPSYNHAPFVEKCLRSIINQTLTPKKLLVIDDGSKDGSPQIIERILKDCQFAAELKVEKNRGLCATLNAGFAESGGDFFAYLGSDDVWFPGFLEKRRALLEKRPNAVLAFGHGLLIDEADRIIDRTEDWTDFADGDLLPQLLRGQIFPSASVVYRRSALAKYRWNEDSRLEDYEMYLKLAADGEFAFDPQLLCAWRQHGSNVSGDFPLMMQEWLEAQNRVADRLKMSRAELAKIQTELKFDAVLSYVRHGRRRDGLKLFYENLGGAKSLAHIGKTLFRLAIPAPIFDWNRRRKRLRTIEKYGKLDLAHD